MEKSQKIKIIKVKDLSKLKFSRYIYETTQKNPEEEELKAIEWASKRGATKMYKFDMGHGIKWIIEAMEDNE